MSDYSDVLSGATPLPPAEPAPTFPQPAFPPPPSPSTWRIPEPPYQMPTEPALKKGNALLRWIGFVVVALVVIGGVAGSGDDSSGAYDGGGTGVSYSDDEAFLSQLGTSEFSDLYALVPDSQLIDLAHTTCDAYDNGATDDGLASILADLDGTYRQKLSMAYLAGAAVGVYCPEHSN
jgi:hypothetical protein